MSRYKKLYDALLINKELFDIDSNFTGVWEDDKKRFIDVQDALENLTQEQEYFEDEEEQDENFY